MAIKAAAQARESVGKGVAVQGWAASRGFGEAVDVAAAPAFRFGEIPLQAKLTVGQPGDPFEQEADQMAERVMRMPEPAGVSGAVSRVGGDAVQRMCSSCEEEDRVQRKAEGSLVGERAAPAIVHDVLRSPGQPLDAGVRSFMEPRFGHDFGRVRVHTDAKAAKSAAAVNALAYTVGNDVVLGGGARAPGSAQGDRLLAHELTHVVQQDRAPVRVQRQLFPPMPILVQPPPSSAPPLEVNAVDARQETSTPWYQPSRYTGPLANFFLGDVTMTDVASMATNVLGFLNGRSMQRLNIMDHGNEDGAEIGDDWLASPADVTAHAGDLGRLRSSFAGGAFVHMQNCRAGQNQALICALAQAFGTPVYAGTGLQNPLLGFNLGDYVRCDPDGTFNPDAGRPRTYTPPPTIAQEQGAQEQGSETA